MTISLANIPLKSAAPQLLEFGADLVPVMGGVRQRLNRLGTRWMFAFQTPLMPALDARPWATRLAQGKLEGVVAPIYEPDLPDVAYGAPKIASVTTGGMSVPLKGLTAGVTVPADKWLSFIHGGRRYLHRTTAAAVAAADGTASVAIFPMLRTPLAVNDIVETAASLQGLLDGPISWPSDLDETVDFQFTVSEAR